MMMFVVTLVLIALVEWVYEAEPRGYRQHLLKKFDKNYAELMGNEEAQWEQWVEEKEQWDNPYQDPDQDYSFSTLNLDIETANHYHMKNMKKFREEELAYALVSRTSNWMWQIAYKLGYRFQYIDDDAVFSPVVFGKYEPTVRDFNHKHWGENFAIEMIWEEMKKMKLNKKGSICLSFLPGMSLADVGAANPDASVDEILAFFDEAQEMLDKTQSIRDELKKAEMFCEMDGSTDLKDFVFQLAKENFHWDDVATVSWSESHEEMEYYMDVIFMRGEEERVLHLSFY